MAFQVLKGGVMRPIGGPTLSRESGLLGVNLDVSAQAKQCLTSQPEVDVDALDPQEPRSALIDELQHFVTESARQASTKEGL